MRVLQEFKTDRSALEGADRNAEAHGATVLYDAVCTALKELQKDARIRDTAGPMRHVAVVLSDGEDTASLVGFEDPVALATARDVAIYTIRTGTLSSTSPQYHGAEFVLRELAKQWAGVLSTHRTQYELRGDADVRRELAQQYTVGYIANDARNDGRLRRGYAQITRAGAQARTRRSYVAPNLSKGFRR